MIQSPIHRKVLSIAWPMIIAGASGPLLGIVDTAILGHLDSARYLSAVAVGASALTLVLWLLSFLRMGTTGLVARAWGQGDRQLCRELLWQSLLLAGALGVFLVALQGPLLRVTLWLLGPGEGTYPIALEYCQIRIWAAPATLCSYAAVGWLLGLQRARQTLVVMVTTNVANIGLDFVFIIGLEMNSAGAAWASVLAEYLGLAVVLWMVRRELQRLGGYVAPRQLVQWRSYGQLLAVNRDLFLRTASIVFVFTFFTAQGARLGDDIVAANAVSDSAGAAGVLRAGRFCTRSGVFVRPRYWRRQVETLLRHQPRLRYLGGGYCRGLPAWPICCSATLLWPHLRICHRLPSWSLTTTVGWWLFRCWPRSAIHLMAFCWGRAVPGRCADTMFAALLIFLACWWLTSEWGNTGFVVGVSACFMGARSGLMSIAFWWLSRRGWQLR